MLTKLQIKLLSNSGELLNVVTCHAGLVCVFRGASPSEIRPYQRALTGSAGRERFSISLDGRDFVADEHTFIGFGEPVPYNGMTVRDFLRHSGALDGSIEGLLIAYGLTRAGDALCADLTQDEERRVRLLAATFTPTKAVILNEPFEPIAGTWRERFAELLTTFARSQKGMVVVTSLSNRPECWVDNDSVERIQVGQTAQRTVGFRARSATTTKLMQQLRQIIGDDAKVEQLLDRDSSPLPSNSSTAALGAAALGATTVHPQSHQEAISILNGRIRPSLFQLAALGGIAIGITALGGLYALRQSSSPPETTSVASVTTESPNSEPISNTQQPAAPSTEGVLVDSNSAASGSQSPADLGNTQSGAVIAPPLTEPAVGPKLLVDEYPEAIRTSLLDAARGILRAPQADSDAPATAPLKDRTPPVGNLFSLLEGASSKESEGGPRAEQSQIYDDSPAVDSPAVEDAGIESPDDVESRREEIRQKFLESIRAAAERRDQQAEE